MRRFSSRPPQSLPSRNSLTPCSVSSKILALKSEKYRWNQVFAPVGDLAHLIPLASRSRDETKSKPRICSLLRRAPSRCFRDPCFSSLFCRFRNGANSASISCLFFFLKSFSAHHRPRLRHHRQHGQAGSARPAPLRRRSTIFRQGRHQSRAGTGSHH